MRWAATPPLEWSVVGKETAVTLEVAARSSAFVAAKGVKGANGPADFYELTEGEEMRSDFCVFAVGGKPLQYTPAVENFCFHPVDRKGEGELRVLRTPVLFHAGGRIRRGRQTETENAVCVRSEDRWESPDDIVRRRLRW